MASKEQRIYQICQDDKAEVQWCPIEMRTGIGSLMYLLLRYLMFTIIG